MDGTGGYRVLAQLQLAGALIKQGKKAEAIATYEALAKDDKLEPTDAARVRRACRSPALRVGEADFTEMENRLTPLMGDESPWRYSARELLGLAAFKAGKTARRARS